jgi:hypothetical protein
MIRLKHKKASKIGIPALGMMPKMILDGNVNLPFISKRLIVLLRKIYYNILDLNQM